VEVGVGDCFFADVSGILNRDLRFFLVTRGMTGMLRIRARATDLKNLFLSIICQLLD
jgi:hypothetical protein